MIKNSPLAIGVIETNSIPRGVKVIDEMVKKAEVTVVESSPICPGKYLNIISGSLSSVRSAIEHGIKTAGTFLVDTVIIPDIDDSVLKAIMRATLVKEIKSIGIIETHAMATAIEVADLVVKSADVVLVEVRLAKCLGGKSFVSFTGDIASVRSGADVGEELARSRGQLVYSVVISNPHKKLHSFIG
jgi:microcompartment protein CcmL/EutN